MPCTEYHKQLISPKPADLTNSSSSSSASSSQAAAFLKSFVEEGTKWVHLDIAGTGDISGDATGWGSRLLIEYARHISAKNQ
jgi:leucyl aminopeptidase